MSNDKSIGRLEGKMEGLEDQVKAVFRRQDKNAKEVRDALRPIQEAALKGVQLYEDVQARLEKIEPKVENHEKHKNRIGGIIIGSGIGGGAIGTIVHAIAKKLGIG